MEPTSYSLTRFPGESDKIYTLDHIALYDERMDLSHKTPIFETSVKRISLIPATLRNLTENPAT